MSLPERRDLREKAKQIRPGHPIRPDELVSANTSPFEPIDLSNFPPEVRQALSRRGLLDVGLGSLPIPKLSSHSMREDY